MGFPTILHSVGYSGSWGQALLTPEQFVDKAADLGFDGVLLVSKRPHVSALDYGRTERRRLRRHLQERGLQHVYIAGYNNFTADLEHADIPNIEIQINYVTELAHLAHDLGGNLVRVFTGYEHPANGFRKQWDLIVRALKECSRRAADLGVVIGVQNHHDIGVGFEAQHELVTSIDEANCRALFDAWAPAIHGVDIKAAARKMAPLTIHTTVANYIRQPRYRYDAEVINYTPLQPVMQAVPIDEGFIDFAGFLAALAESGFTGSVGYEACSPLIGGGDVANLDRYSMRFLQFMQQLPFSGARTRDMAGPLR
jgi:sugar phosphate isomerase/epimerase